jgi:antitoxin ParD1/3/4
MLPMVEAMRSVRREKPLSYAQMRAKAPTDSQSEVNGEGHSFARLPKSGTLCRRLWECRHGQEHVSSVGDHFAELIDRQVSQGRYASASDVVRAGLRLLEERETEVEALRAALVEGERSGASTPFDFDDFVKRKRQRKGKARDRT